GEVACTGVHGANRLASNSLLEGLVFGARSAAAMLNESAPEASGASTAYSPHRSAVEVDFPEAEVRQLMWDAAGIFRDADGLRHVVQLLDSPWHAAVAQLTTGRIASVASWQRLSVIGVGRLIARAALRRE